MESAAAIDAICRIPDDYYGWSRPSTQKSWLALLADAGYAALRPRLTVAVLSAHIRAHPELIEQWERYSEDKRTSGGFGFLSPRDDSAADACAEYILRELDCLSAAQVMIDLDSRRWRELRHAYGPATDTPRMLRRLFNAWDRAEHDQAWFDIWSALAHQGDVYSASYAAVPHVIVFAGSKPLRERSEAVHFVAWVETCRHVGRADPMPPDLEAGYRWALAQLLSVIVSSTNEKWDRDTTQVMAGALVAVKGHAALADEILNLELRTRDSG